MFRTKVISVCSAGVLAIAILGCNRDEAKVQMVPKDSSAPTAPSPDTASATPPPMDVHAGMNAAPESLRWTLPAGWEEKPLSQMRVASFSAMGKAETAVDISVIPLPASGREIDLVNMWRQLMHLPPITDIATNQIETIAIGSESGKLFDIVSEEAMVEGKARGRILVGMLTRGPTSWFFKMTGEDSAVTEQKLAFLQFLKSVSFAAQPAEPNAAAKNPAPMESKSQIWMVPNDWREGEPSQFLFAKYIIPGPNGTQADVNISRLGGEGGGALANVNRWRGQLGLARIATEEDASKLMTLLPVSGGQAILVDMTGTDVKTGNKSRLVATIVPQAGQTWFYKLMGDEAMVGQHKQAFTKFIQSAKYSNAP